VLGLCHAQCVEQLDVALVCLLRPEGRPAGVNTDVGGVADLDRELVDPRLDRHDAVLEIGHHSP